MIWRLSLGFCLGMLLLSCGAQTPIQPTPTSFGDLTGITAGTGHINIFSGMPNPQWALDAGAVAHIQQVLESATSVAPPPEAPGLGYSGMVLDLVSTGMPIQLTIFNQVITLRQAGSTHYLSDPNQALERWLLENARPQLAPEIYDLVKPNLP